MKLLRLLITLFFLLNLTSVHAQVPNPSFENWTGDIPVDWLANNSPGQYEPITQSSDAHTGNFAVKGEVVSYLGFGIPPFFNTAQTGGFPMTQLYPTMTGWFKGNLLDNDVFTISISVYDASSNAIGSGQLNLTSSATWQEFTVTMNYYVPGAVPASAEISLYIYDTTPGDTATTGSYFIADDLEFSLSAAIEKINPSTFVVSPSPANQKINILGSFISGEALNLTVIDLLGKPVMHFIPQLNADGSVPPIDISPLSDGIYTLNISDSKKSLSKKIVIAN